MGEETRPMPNDRDVAEERHAACPGAIERGPAIVVDRAHDREQFGQRADLGDERRHGVLSRGVANVQKPFTPMALACAIAIETEATRGSGVKLSSAAVILAPGSLRA